MSTGDTLDYIADVIRNLNPAPQPPFDRVYVYPIETAVPLPIAAGVQIVTPLAMTGIVVGSVLGIDVEANREEVLVTAVTDTTFTAEFALAHAADTPVEVVVDTRNVDGNQYPFAVVQHDVIGNTDNYTRFTQAESRHRWTAAVDMFLGEKDTPQTAVESRAIAYYEALQAAFLPDPTMGGTVEYFGTNTPESELMSLRTGWMHWFDQEIRNPNPKFFWGITLLFRITQILPYAEDYQPTT